MDKKNLIMIQVIITAVIFLLFFFSVFFVEAYMVRYLLMLLVIANMVLLFVNHTKGLIVNFFMLVMTFLMYIFIIEYIASIVGLLLSFYHGLRIFFVWYGGAKPIGMGIVGNAAKIVENKPIESAVKPVVEKKAVKPKRKRK